MEDSYVNNTSQMESNSNNGTSNYQFTDNPYYLGPDIKYVLTCIIIGIGLPLTLLAIYSLSSQIKNTNVAPIFIINLLISDILQFCYMIVVLAKPEDPKTYELYPTIYLFGLLASVCFMVCIALERYLVIVWPLWYHNRRTIDISLVVCIVVWTFPLVVVLPSCYRIDYVVFISISAVFLLIPFPLLIFFLVGTLKGLSAAISVPSDEKRRIVGVSVLVLLIYMLLFLPVIILFLVKTSIQYIPFTKVFMLLKFSPLAHLILYFFMRKGPIDKILASLCCFRMDSDDNSK